MTNEAKERAIRWLTEEVRSLRMAPKVNGCKPDNWAEQLAVMETCLEVVRGCNQVANKSQFGCNPLTMEQLREMDGEPVVTDGTWCYLEKIVDGIAYCWRWYMDFADEWPLDQYGETWLAYRRPPEGEA